MRQSARARIMRAIAGFSLASMPLLTNTSAQAQGFELNRFRPAPLVVDGFQVGGTETLGHLGYDLNVTLDYAHEPLVVELATGQQYAVVEHQLALHVTGALGVGKRTLLFAGIPVNAWMDGNDPPDGITTRLPRPEGGGFGDMYLGARVRLLGDSHSRFALAGQAALSIPLASVNGDQLYSGDDMVAFKPEVLADIHVRRSLIRLNVGARIRQDEEIVGTRVGDELTFGAGVDVPVHRALRIIGDIYGAMGFRDLESRNVPLELLVGGKYLSQNGFHASLAGGPGLVHGLGTPDGRVILQLGYARIKREKPPVTPARDQSRLKDTDGDGFHDPHDRCVTEPEDVDKFADEDGCPDPDNDSDGVLDVQDRCVNDAEDRDNFEDEDGCPDADNDKDGIVDGDDRCVNEPGIVSDGGCPAAKPEAPVAQPKAESMGSIFFAPASENPLPKSYAVLWRAHRTLRDNPQLTHVQIEGHTDLVGASEANQALSRRRARAIARWLQANGLAVDRLHIVACGEKRLAVEGDAEDREENRRVELFIGERPDVNCEPVTVK